MKNLFSFFSRKKNRKNPFRKIEEDLNAEYPNSFKELVTPYFGLEIQLHLPDQEYKMISPFGSYLSSLIGLGEVVQMSKAIKNIVADNDDLVVLPFAQLASESNYFFLFFISNKGNKSDGACYFTDVDSSTNSYFQIVDDFSFFFGEPTQVEENKVSFHYKVQTFGSAFARFPIQTDILPADNGKLFYNTSTHNPNFKIGASFALNTKVNRSADFADFNPCVYLNSADTYIFAAASFLVSVKNMIPFIMNDHRESKTEYMYYLKLKCFLQLLSYLRKQLDSEDAVKNSEFIKMIDRVDVYEMANTKIDQIDFM